MKHVEAAAPAKGKPVLSHRHAIGFAIVTTMLVAAAVLGLKQRTYADGYVVIGDGIRVRTTVALTDAAREKGLSGHKPLAADEGMLFVFARPDVYGFWMKEMLFPIDILWLEGGKVADITTDLPQPLPGQRLDQLPVFYPRVPVDRVLEVPAGFAQAHGLKLGMPVEYHVDSLQGVR